MNTYIYSYLSTCILLTFLRTFTIGICGSDVHFWKHGRIGSSVICASQGLGHESAGEIVKIGENVHGFKVGMLFFLVCYIVHLGLL